MERGRVKWFDEEKGYGFIESTTAKKDYFVHKSSIEELGRNLEKGQLVTFNIGEGKGGRDQAIDVRLVTE